MSLKLQGNTRPQALPQNGIGPIVRRWISRQLFKPMFASLIRERLTALLLGGIVVLQVGLVIMGLRGWRCPIRETLGIPCPGCGLSIAMVTLLQGKWREALSLHAFAPIFLFGSALTIAVSLLPTHPRRAVINQIATLERRTGITVLLMIALIVYWIVRLLGLL